MALKVLHITKELNSGGIEAVVCSWFKNIDRERIDFDFAIHWHGEKGIHEDEVKKAGAKIYRFKNINECKSIKKYKQQWEKFWKEHSDEYSIVHIHYMSHAGVIVDVAKKYGIYTVAHSHSTITIRKNLKQIASQFINKNLTKKTDVLLACSQKAGIDFFGTEFNSRGTVIRNAIDISHYRYNDVTRNDVREKHNLTDKIVVGHIGNYVAAKNQDFMLEIFSEIAKLNPDTYLVWGGFISDKDMVHIQDLLNKYKIRDRVTILGRCRNVNEWMQAFDFFLFPSLYEGLGVVLIEAQAAGLYCVISDTIPKEADVTDLITRCSLNDSPKLWAETLLSHIDYGRRNHDEEIIWSGYAIEDTTKQLTQLYFDIVNKNDF